MLIVALAMLRQKINDNGQYPTAETARASALKTTTNKSKNPKLEVLHLARLKTESAGRQSEAAQ